MRLWFTALIIAAWLPLIALLLPSNFPLEADDPWYMRFTMPAALASVYYYLPAGWVAYALLDAGKGLFLCLCVVQSGLLTLVIFLVRNQIRRITPKNKGA